MEGEYNLRVTVFGNGQEKIQEVPITIAKKRSMGLFAVAFSFGCFILVCLTIGQLKKCIFDIGAKGAITIACLRLWLLAALLCRRLYLVICCMCF